MFTRMLPAIRWMFTRAFIVASVALFAAYFLILGGTWSEFSQHRRAALLAPHHHVRSIVVLWLTGARRDPHPRAWSRLHLQVLRRRSARDGLHAHLLSAGVLLQRERRVELSERCALGCGSLPPAGGSSSWWRASRRSSGTSAAPGTLASEVAVAAMIVGGATTLSRTRIRSSRSTATSRSPTGSRFRTCESARTSTSGGGCVATYFVSTARARGERSREARVPHLRSARAVLHRCPVHDHRLLARRSRGSCVRAPSVSLIVLGSAFMLMRRGLVEWGRSIALSVSRLAHGAAAKRRLAVARSA